MSINLVSNGFTKNEHKVYAIALIVALIILPYGIKIYLRTDISFIEWLYNFSKTGSVRRELDDNLYVYIYFINAILDLKKYKDDC